MSKKGFSLAEILIVVVVASVLVAISVPNFLKTIEKENARQAMTYLRLIRSAQKVYHSNHGTYVNCADVAAIRTNLGIEINNGDYSFTVTGADGTTFTANATKGASSITLTADCVWAKTDDLTYVTLPTSC
ncbi:MAG TPA: type IV pilin protein [Candidatus Omnitrophota bacterium]|nr:type IV pilin protein [Candidatus Omnitrophota bacterium]